VQSEPDLVTGDAVVLELHTATVASRSVAFALDVALQAAVLLALGLLLSGVDVLDSAMATVVMLVVVVLVVVGYPVIFETLNRGRSLGKLALGLRVVRDDGGPIRFRHALTRGLSGFFVDFWALGFFGAVALIVSLCSDRGKRVGDLLAGTVVIRERVPAGGAGPIEMPPPLAAWAAQLDLSDLPAELAMASRQYLGRYGQLSDSAREHLGARLAGEVAHRLGAPVPPGTPAWAYLSAVLAERRAREQARVSGWTVRQPEPGPRPPATPPPAPPAPRSDGPFAPPG
jgi:uncharacterized RDD family membrane protein YckC